MATASAKDPLTCGFLKVKVFQLLTASCYGLRGGDKQDIGVIYAEHCANIKAWLGSEFEFSTDHYKFNLVPLRDIFRKLSQNSPKKKTIITQTFSDESWEKLDNAAKRKHTPGDCEGCLENRRFKNGLSQFPIKGNQYILKAKKYGLIREPLSDVTNKISLKKQEELIKRKTVKQIEEMKKKTAVVR